MAEPPTALTGAASSGMLALVDMPDSPVGYLCRDVPLWVSHPPIESVVFAWGASEDHQLGLDTEQDIYQPKVVESLLGIRFMGRSFGSCPLVGGSRNTLALDADGGLWSWGWNDRGTLGHGHRALQRKPAPVQGLSDVEVVQAAIGGWHCLALDAEGQVYCWGGNEYQQCGWVAPDSDDAPSNGRQLEDSRAGRWRSSSSGGGAVSSGVHGVLPSARDILVPRICMPGLTVKQVACGGMNSVVLTDTGEVWTWGEPWGDFAIDTQRAPRKVDGAVNIAAIACGAFHNLALVADGSVLSWGTNDYGQLGNGSTIYSTTPVEVCDLEDVAVADIAAGGWHSMALTADGQIYVWGRGEYGRLGIGDRTGSSKLRPHKIRGLEEHVVVQVAAGGTHSCCVTSSGRMFIWGRASYGRLGLGRDARDMYAPVEVQLPGGHQRWRIAAATAGGRHTMCLAVPVRDGIKGSSVYGGNSEGIPSRAASVVNEPINGASAPISRANGGGSSAAAAGAPANGAAAGGGVQAGAATRQLPEDSQQQQQQQQQQGRVYDPFATQQQQQQQQAVHQGSGSGRSGAPADTKASRSGSGGSTGAGAGGGSRGLSAVGVSSPYQPGGPLPHGPALSMQSSYSLVTSPGSSILGGGSPPGVVFPAAAVGGVQGGSWAGPLLKAQAVAAAAASSSVSSAGPGAAAAGEALGAAGQGASVAGASDSPAAAPVAAPSASPRVGSAGGAAGTAGSSSSAAAGAAAAAAAGRSSLSLSPPPEMVPLGVEAVHAATEAAVQQVCALRLHGLLPGGAASGNGSMQGMALTSHGPLAAAAAAAGSGSGSGLKAGQGSGVSPRGMPPPMSPSQRAVGLDMGSALREFANTGDAYDISGRGDSMQWQHQDVSLQLQADELMIEDDAIQQELQEEQQREADEAALEAAEEQQEEEVRLRRQEQQAQLREAQIRQQHQQHMGGSGSLSGSQQGGSSYTGLGFIGPGSSGSNSGRPGSSQGRSSFAAAAGSMQPMRRSHSHQQLADPLAVVAAAVGMEMASPRGSLSLQRYGSSPHSAALTGASSSQPQQQQHRNGSGGGGGGSLGGAAAGARAPSGAVNMPSFSAGMGGMRRMAAAGFAAGGPSDGRPGVGRVDSDASQDLAGLEGGSPADSPRNSSAAMQGSGTRRAGSASAEAGGPGSLGASRGSLGSISGDSSSGQAELGASPPTGRYDVGLGERYDAVGSLPGREQLHHLAHT